jgi:4-hydroxybenzoate polyprenyltransferase
VPARTARGLLRATHPLPCLAVTAGFSATAASAGVGARSALLAVAVLCGQASVGWSNDAIDAVADTTAGRPDKPIATGEVSRRLVARCAIGALAIDVPLSLSLGWRAGLAHLVAVALAWGYNLGLKRTRASPLPYAAAFGLVPVIVAAMLPGSPHPRVALVVAGACCGVAGHFANTVGDAREDALTGVRGLPQRLGPARSTLVAGGFLAAASVAVLAATGDDAIAIAAVAVDVVIAAALPLVVRAHQVRSLAFRLMIIAVAVLLAAFVVSGGSNLTGR